MSALLLFILAMRQKLKKKDEKYSPIRLKTNKYLDKTSQSQGNPTLNIGLSDMTISNFNSKILQCTLSIFPYCVNHTSVIIIIRLYDTTIRYISDSA